MPEVCMSKGAVRYVRGEMCGMPVSRETKCCNAVCIGLVLMAGLLRLAMKRWQLVSYNGMIFVLFAAAACLWIFQLQKRLLQSDARHNLVSAAVLMIFWMAIRTYKYEILPSGHCMSRYIWYLYYVPMVMIPLLMFLSVLTIGKPYCRTLDRRWYLLFIPAAALIMGILTNDVHQKAFFFHDGLSDWDENHMIRGFVYYAAMAWMVLLFIAILTVVLIRCAVPQRRKRIWVPLLPLLVGVIYTLSVVVNRSNLLTDMLRAPEIGCLVFAAFMESLICVRLFPNNDNYGAFWHASSIGAGIMDRQGTIRFRSEKSVSVTPEQVRQALQDAVFLDNGRLRLKSHEIRGGFGYWVRDISEIRRLNEQLEELGNVTAQENSMMAAENSMRAERLHIEEQNRLYDDMARGVKRQLDALDNLLNSLPEDEAAFQAAMKYACILNAYVKRHSNLLLLSHQDRVIHSEELRHALTESLEYVKLYGIRTQCFFDGKGNLSGEAAVFAYELFEDVLETSLPGADNILVYAQKSEKELCLRMELNAPEALFDNPDMRQQATNFGGTLELETDDTTEYVTLMLPSGGTAL